MDPSANFIPNLEKPPDPKLFPPLDPGAGNRKDTTMAANSQPAKKRDATGSVIGAKGGNSFVNLNVDKFAMERDGVQQQSAMECENSHLQQVSHEGRHQEGVLGLAKVGSGVVMQLQLQQQASIGVGKIGGQTQHPIAQGVMKVITRIEDDYHQSVSRSELKEQEHGTATCVIEEGEKQSSTVGRGKEQDADEFITVVNKKQTVEKSRKGKNIKQGTSKGPSYASRTKEKKQGQQDRPATTSDLAIQKRMADLHRRFTLEVGPKQKGSGIKKNQNQQGSSSKWQPKTSNLAKDTSVSNQFAALKDEEFSIMDLEESVRQREAGGCWLGEFCGTIYENSIWSIVNRLVFSATVYYIWQERNLRRYENKYRPVDDLCSLILGVVRLRLMSLNVKGSRASMEVMKLWDTRGLQVGSTTDNPERGRVGQIVSNVRFGACGWARFGINLYLHLLRGEKGWDNNNNMTRDFGVGNNMGWVDKYHSLNPKGIVKSEGLNRANLLWAWDFFVGLGMQRNSGWNAYGYSSPPWNVNYQWMQQNWPMEIIDYRGVFGYLRTSGRDTLQREVEGLVYQMQTTHVLVWFHASVFGNFEMLVNKIQRLLRTQKCVDHDVQGLTYYWKGMQGFNIECGDKRSWCGVLKSPVNWCNQLSNGNDLNLKEAKSLSCWPDVWPVRPDGWTKRPVTWCPAWPGRYAEVPTRWLLGLRLLLPPVCPVAVMGRNSVFLGWPADRPVECWVYAGGHAALGMMATGSSMGSYGPWTWFTKLDVFDGS
ncbi:hypothetical protein E3N88_05142 [Mikania micrantha]|uniref:Uncharacterized protein n=1 Tax=Mikania micrantha TaxID=192012 RepID=A0A5N6PWG0_9ASTR|nr:hypothetical protein E3N88_05142 [Mikania micrantha]